jgi:hypothetical protein
MARPPTPATLTGDFFVLAWDRAGDHYVIYLDDADRSSYRLGAIQQARIQFKVWGLSELGDCAIDQAREFGTVQVVPSKNKIINLIPRNSKPKLVFQEETRSTYVNPF